MTRLVIRGSFLSVFDLFSEPLAALASCVILYEGAFVLAGGEILLFFYFSGSFLAFVLTVMGWAYVAFLKRSPLEANLAKINMSLSWRNAEPTCCTNSPGALVRLNFFSKILIENMIWSWLGIGFYVSDRFLAMVKFFTADDSFREARRKLWNEDLEIDEVWRLVYVLYSGQTKSQNDIALEIQDILSDESDLNWLCPEQGVGEDATEVLSLEESKEAKAS